MTATARSLALVQESTKSRHNVKAFKEHFETIRNERSEAQVPNEQPVLLPCILVSESATMISLLIPLDGIDVRGVYIFATPRSIVLEIVTKYISQHSGTLETEIQRHRITRELIFRSRIAKRSTMARLSGGSLEMTSLKAESAVDEAWSEFIQVDTRCSLGVPEAPMLYNPIARAI